LTALISVEVVGFAYCHWCCRHWWHRWICRWRQERREFCTLASLVACRLPMSLGSWNSAPST